MSTPTIPTSIKLSIAIALFTSVTSLVTGYFHNDRAMGERVSVVETRQQDDTQAIERIEKTQIRLESKLDQLIYWALGKPVK